MSWCAGIHPQGPHVVEDAELIQTNIGPDIKLCRPCWSRWVRVDHAEGVGR